MQPRSLKRGQDLAPNLVDALVCVREGNSAPFGGLVVLKDWDRLVVVLLEALLQRVLVVVRTLHQRLAGLVVLHILHGRGAYPVVGLRRRELRVVGSTR